MIKRRGSRSYTDDSPSESRTICNYCKTEMDTIIKTVPYIMKDGRPDKNFRYCENCRSVIPISVQRFESITEPLGSLAGKQPTFEVVSSSSSRKRRNKNSLEPTEEPIPFLNNKPDKDLESLLIAHNAILVSYSDENTDMEEPEY